MEPSAATVSTMEEEDYACVVCLQIPPGELCGGGKLWRVSMMRLGADIRPTTII